MVGWEDIPDSDWGDFRRRRAVDISSLIMMKTYLKDKLKPAQNGNRFAHESYFCQMSHLLLHHSPYSVPY